jgi:phosphate transport system substrate-binding protein
MKNRIALITLLMLTSVLVFAQQKNAGIVKLRGTRLTHPLVNKWIAEFKKEYPDIKVAIAQDAPADSIDFSIASYALSAKELEGNKDAVVITRYVQLPVVNSNRPGLAELQEKGVKEKDLQDLFFTDTAPVFLASSNSQSSLALYVRDRPVCAVKAFAAHYGNDPKKINGIAVKGDDRDLAEAVKKDINGISFNNLGFIYDVTTRKIVKDLAIIPLDLNENGKVDKDEQIYNTVDEVIAYIERTKNPKFINERVNFIFDKGSTNASAAIFLNWVLNKGQKFNHDLGFINLEDKFLQEQKVILKSNFKVSSTSSCEGLDKLAQERKATKANNN